MLTFILQPNNAITVKDLATSKLIVRHCASVELVLVAVAILVGSQAILRYAGNSGYMATILADTS